MHLRLVNKKAFGGVIVNDATKKVLKEIISDKKEFLKHIDINIKRIDENLDAEKVLRNKILKEIKDLEEDLSK